MQMMNESKDAQMFDSEIANGEAVIVRASMSQVEMTVWLCIMAVLALGMLAILAIAQ